MKILFALALLAALPSAPPPATTFTLAQLVALHQLVDLPTIGAALEAQRWVYDESQRGEDIDQVVWVKAATTGVPKQAITVWFCHNSAVAYCPDPAYHLATDDPTRHIYSFIYQPGTLGFAGLKRQAEAAHLALTTTVEDGNLEYTYTGAHYEISFRQEHPNIDRPVRYLVFLRQKPM